MPLNASLCPAEQPCRIEVVEKDSRWPVPLVELRTVHNVAFVTDNAGIAAFDLPELMGQETWLSIRSDGYEVPADGFGFRGVRITPSPGGRITVEVERTQLAKRLGRLTGAGLFAESQRFGEHADRQESGIVGCDSVQVAEYRGRLFWAWGDTSLAKYPLGLFQMTGATTTLRPLERLQPPIELQFDFFRGPVGEMRTIADIGGSGPTWLYGFAALTDAAGEEHLVATYEKIKPPLTPYETGMCEWDDSLQKFSRKHVLWQAEEGGTAPRMPSGHPVRWTDSAGEDWLLFGHGLPDLMIRPSYEEWADPAKWVPVPEKQLIAQTGSDKALRPHRGSLAWNDYLQRWIFLFTESHGEPSAFGEIWLARADSPLGPWGDAVKVATHANYTFYNPRLHPELTTKGEPALLFEGTYTGTFADEPEPTPRYDYNQIMYRIDLDDSAFDASTK